MSPLVRLLWFLIITFNLNWALANPVNSGEAYLLNIQGGIGPATADYIHRGIAQANARKARVIILQLDTPGGLSTSMRDIIKDIVASDNPIIAYVAPSGARAASAGTYILYAAHIAAMAPGTNLGAATPVAVGMPGLTSEKNSKESAGDVKAINDAKAYIRSLAQLRHRNITWAESAVTKGESISASEALKLKVINYIAEDIAQVLQKANHMPVEIHGNTVTMQTLNLSVVLYQPDWRSRLLAIITDPSVAYILLMIGFYGIFFEFFSPGYVAPGVIGSICLLLSLYAFALLPINFVGAALLVLGIAFMIGEAFMPSFGALGIGGIVSFAIGSFLLLKTEYIGFTLPSYLILIVTLFTLGFILLVLSMVYRARRRPVVSGREALIGKKGLIDIDADGKKWVRIEGERWQCRSDIPVNPGAEVIVKSVEGLILVVEPVIK